MLRSISAALFLTSVLFLSSLAIAGDSVYPGYTFHELGDGIYVHAQDDPLGAPVDGNSTIIVNDDDVFVIDTHINPAVARALVQKIKTITTNPVSHIVNTHWHDDHTNGNHAFRQAWPDAVIVSHRETLEALREGWQKLEDDRVAAFEGADPEKYLQVADQMEEIDPDRATNIRVYVGYVQALEPEIASMELVYPDTVFDDTLLFTRGNRRIELRWLGKANTDGDTVVWLPDDGILVTGDMLVAPIPFAFDSPIQEWIDTLQKLEDIGIDRIIPGHGPVMSDDRYLRSVRSLLQALLDSVREAAESGVAFNDVESTVDLEEFRPTFAGDARRSNWAWKSYFLQPGIKSAWVSLGLAVPEEDAQ